VKLRPLGSSGLKTGPLAFGGNVFGWTVDEHVSFSLLDAFTAAGLNLVDTADVYSTWTRQPGISETIIGRWLKQSGKRGEVVIATKVGMEMEAGKSGLSKKHIFASVEDSLRRLQTDYIDLYQAHADDPGTPLEETLSAFARLKEEGKIRAFGASNYSPVRLRAALNITDSYKTLQPLYNLYDRNAFESGLLPLCQERGLGVIPYFPLASGFLTGKYRTQTDLAGKKRGLRVAGYMDERGMRILAALDRAAKETKASAAQVALAWVMGRPGVTAPIVSASSIAQLQELIAACELRIPAEILTELEAASLG
jgi:aryl-alcohol dehydrogenase-like predicted oxidoreductase